MVVQKPENRPFAYTHHTSVVPSRVFFRMIAKGFRSLEGKACRYRRYTRNQENGLRGRFKTTSISDQNTVAVVDLVLNDLGSPAGESLDPGLKRSVLILHLDLLKPLGFTDAG